MTKDFQITINADNGELNVSGYVEYHTWQDAGDDEGWDVYHTFKTYKEIDEYVIDEIYWNGHNYQGDVSESRIKKLFPKLYKKIFNYIDEEVYNG